MAYGTYVAGEGSCMKGFGGKRRQRLMSKDSIKKDLKEVRLDCVECSSLSEDINNWRAFVEH